jgi:Flp pilus assembly protein TadB
MDEMTGSFGRGVLEGLRQPVDRHLAAATVAFVATIAVTVMVIARWPGGAPLVTPIVGLAAAFAVAILVSRLLDRRNPYFGTREEVEQVLGLPVLAVCPRRER